MSDIAIVGAGIGGISTAIFLKKMGYDCRIYEQAPAFLPLGAGINFAPNGTRVFRAMGLGDKMVQVGIQPRIRSNRKWDSGEPFHVFNNLNNSEKYGSEFVAFHRAALHGMLVEAAGTETFQLGKHLTGLRSEQDFVELHFADGTKVQASAVIGADGLHSTVARATTGSKEPRYFGHTAYRAIVPTEKLRGRLPLTDYIRWWGPNQSYILAYCMKEDREEYNIVASGPEEIDMSELRPMPVTSQKLLSNFQGFHSDALHVLENCQEVVRWPMMIRPPERPWSRGRTTLLGDAAHPMTPHLGQGGGMAVEDAAIVARCIDRFEGRDIEQSFRLYEAVRFQRTADVQFASQENKIGRGERDPAWLFGYDAMSTPLDFE
jgi:2-polyprenyl-6-methoxyphenol hydroxylase-like FAD-dependent oxidoreductase